ncbi:adenylate isopentenyltransferase 1, chloroplastic-like [Salvia miltiorrhiza]|uniref:adenylate isopentenyltransferase 1, chloroplastic-like n=1 Tax=Salvia miltiorrhiza TaxID=226208 RepID=UPI0025ABF39C|nr:adenylate isopentenyltransferase 1, chloroplastic-like [Salvia miltiorrhiza]
MDGIKASGLRVSEAAASPWQGRESLIITAPISNASSQDTTVSQVRREDGLCRRRHRKIVVVMGPTGCDKTKLSIDLASRFFRSSEIVNSDKIQIHRGLDITTNKIPPRDRENVPHHLLGQFDSSESHPEFTPSDFRLVRVAPRVHLRIAGGEIRPRVGRVHRVQGAEVQYKCCFIWVNVSSAVLAEHLVRRVDDMLGSGMFKELAEYFGGCEWDSILIRNEFCSYLELWPEIVKLTPCAMEIGTVASPKLHYR